MKLKVEDFETLQEKVYAKPEYEIGFPGVLELVKEVRNHQTLTSFAVTSGYFSFGSSTTDSFKVSSLLTSAVEVVFSVESKEGGAVVGEEARLTSAEDRLSHSAIPAEVGLVIGKLSSVLDCGFVFERACSVLGTRDDKRKPSKSKSQSSESYSLSIDRDSKQSL
ncbi:unnamed protein product [Brassica oleracea var. botrytis]